MTKSGYKRRRREIHSRYMRRLKRKKGARTEGQAAHKSESPSPPST